MLWLELDGTAIVTTEQRLAVRAAQRGNWKPADGLELLRLRELVTPHDEEGEPHAFPNLAPVAILRGVGPDGEDVALWEFDLPCLRCDGKGAIAADDDPDFDEVDGEKCLYCEGVGAHEGDGTLVTDLDGLILEDDLP